MLEETKEAEWQEAVEVECQQHVEEQCQMEEAAWHQEQETAEQERWEEEAYTGSVWQAAEEQHYVQVHAQVAWRQVVVEVPVVAITEF